MKMNINKTTFNRKTNKLDASRFNRGKLNCSEEVEEELENKEEQTPEVAVTELLIVQEPETKELSLFVPESEDEAVPENVEVIATVETATEEDLDSACHSKKKVNAACGDKKKLNSSEGENNDEGTEEEAKKETSEDVVELPDGETVEIEDIFVVQDEDGEYDLA